MAKYTNQTFNGAHHFFMLYKFIRFIFVIGCFSLLVYISISFPSFECVFLCASLLQRALFYLCIFSLTFLHPSAPSIYYTPSAPSSIYLFLPHPFLSPSILLLAVLFLPFSFLSLPFSPSPFVISVYAYVVGTRTSI